MHALLGAEKFSAKINYKEGRACKKYKHQEGMKAHEDYTLLQKIRGKERLEDYSTSVATMQQMYSNLIGGYSLLFSYLPCCCTFCRPIPTCG